MFHVFWQIVVIRNQKVVHKEKVDFEPSAVAVDPSNSVVAVGSSQVSDQNFHLMSLYVCAMLTESLVGVRKQWIFIKVPSE